MASMGRRQRPVIGTSHPLDGVTILHSADDTNAGFPSMDGTVATPPAKRKRYGPEWVQAEQLRLDELNANPQFRFMLKVEGVTDPMLTRKDFDADHVDQKRLREETNQRQTRFAERIAETKVAMFTRMMGEMSNQQHMRFTTTAGDVDGNGNPTSVVAVDTQPALAPDESNGVQTALEAVRARRAPSNPPITLAAWMGNINVALNGAIEAPLDMSALAAGDSMEWAMDPRHSGKLNYTSRYMMGLESACVKLQAIVGTNLTADQLPLEGLEGTDERLNTLLATLVGFEMLDNDVMITRRYSRQFQGKDLARKRAMLLRSIKVAYGMDPNAWYSSLAATAPWGDGGAQPSTQPWMRLAGQPWENRGGAL
jgi:hypothetical protein